MLLVAAIGAILACLHLGGRVAHLGPGGLKLPAVGTWAGYRDSPGAALMLSAEQFAGLLGVWVTCTAISIALFTRDVARFGNPRLRSFWREVIEGITLVVFGFITAILGIVSLILLRHDRMMLVEVPMPLLVLPVLLLGIVTLANGAVRLAKAWRIPPANLPGSAAKTKPLPANRSARAGMTPGRGGATSGTKPRPRVESGTRSALQPVPLPGAKPGKALPATFQRTSARGRESRK